MLANPPLYTVLPDDSWRGRRCFVVGAGPSLKGFDFDRLRGELSIGVNRAIESFSPSIWFSADSRFIRWIETGELRGGLRDRFRNYKDGLKCLVTTSAGYYAEDIFTLLPANSGGRLSSSMREGIFSGRGRGCNSGLGALNLALCLGADPIYLLGFDMKGGSDGMQTWYHSNYPVIQSADVYPDFIRAFESVAEEAAKKADIINLNSDSTLRCFPFGCIEGVLP